jgi:uncharacterized protein YbjT (DUF2867 family)
MQNLTTTLLPEIQSKSRITLPAGKAKFNWIDVKNIGEASARLILDFEKHENQAYDITGTENKSFAEVADLMSEVTGVPITYRSINPFSFYFLKRREGIPSGFAVVMTILHFLPRLQRPPAVSNNYEMLTGKVPTRLKEFLFRNKALFTDQEQ